jgi:hypothetical protein
LLMLLLIQGCARPGSDDACVCPGRVERRRGPNRTTSARELHAQQTPRHRACTTRPISERLLIVRLNLLQRYR